MKKPLMGVRNPRKISLMVRVTKEERDQILRDSVGARSLSEYMRVKLLEKKTA